MKNLIARILAHHILKKQRLCAINPNEMQQNILKNLLSTASDTRYGKSYRFAEIKKYSDFKKIIPLRTYEDFLPHIDSIRGGAVSELWPGKPIYWAKTSGTTAGSKYIPITKDSLPHHITTARNALLHYIHETGSTDFLDGKMLFLSGSPVLSHKDSIPEGRLSGIVNHHIPWYLKRQHVPSFTINSIEDWEEKLHKIISTTVDKNLTLVSGIPPWVQMFFDRALDFSGKKNIIDLFPNLQILVHGGVNFDPYREKIFATIGKKIGCIETYPTSEGFIAFQNSQESGELLLQLNNDIFYEFIPLEEVSARNPSRLMIDEVEIDKHYAIALTTNAGLWAYMIGDVVRFTNLLPHKIVVTGRVKHFISAFGEHVIGEEVDCAMAHALSKNREIKIQEFTVAPHVSSKNGEKSHHEWFIEFLTPPKDLKIFAQDIEEKLRALNSYYDALISGHILGPLEVRTIPRGGFEKYLKEKNMLGGQNKVVHLSNDREIVEKMLSMLRA